MMVGAWCASRNPLVLGEGGPYADVMKLTKSHHSWRVGPTQAAAIQRELATRVIPRGRLRQARWIAGLDAAFSRDGKKCIGGVVLWDLFHRRVVEKHIAQRHMKFPYIPGLLSFREAPALLAALAKLSRKPDVLMCDGQGLAHPRRFGIACHLGVLTHIPAVGCAKSILVGRYTPFPLKRGAKAALYDGWERIGTVLCTRDGVKPVIVSVGHKLSLRAAENLVLRCGEGFRLPEPTRLAHHLVGALARSTIPSRH